MNRRYSYEITIEDYRKHPIWESDLSNEQIDANGEMLVKPVLELPVSRMDGRIVGTEVTLKCGSCIFAVLIGIGSARYVPISSATFFSDNITFVFRRAAPRTSGPGALAEFLGMTIDEIFPIKYDISKYVTGQSVVAKGEIPLEVQGVPQGMSRKDYFKEILLKQRKQDNY